MSFVVMSKVWEHADIAGDDLVLMLALADQANDDGVCWPSVRLLAARCRRSERWVQYRLSGLVDRRLVAIERRGGDAGTRQQSNVYTLFPDGYPHPGARFAEDPPADPSRGAIRAPYEGAIRAPRGAHSVHRGGAHKRAPLESLREPSTTTPQPPASGGLDPTSSVADPAAAVIAHLRSEHRGRPRAATVLAWRTRAAELAAKFPGAPTGLLADAVAGRPAPNLALYRAAPVGVP